MWSVLQVGVWDLGWKSFGHSAPLLFGSRIDGLVVAPPTFPHTYSPRRIEWHTDRGGVVITVDSGACGTVMPDMVRITIPTELPRRSEPGWSVMRLVVAFS